MQLAVLLPHFAGLRLVRHELFDDELVLELVPPAARARCPACHRRSRRIHSRYTRRIADHPLGGRRVTIQLQVRRFFCRTPTCPRTCPGSLSIRDCLGRRLRCWRGVASG